ncbi:MAG: DUF502 domain-containing protein [Gemmatimonadales bacterium]|jgi:uncharacterized membrane protein
MKQLIVNIRAKLLAGLVVTVPVVATVVALRFLLRNLDALLGPWISMLIGRSVPGLGLLATILLVFIIGVVATNFAGRRLISVMEKAFTSLPLVRRLYGASKDIVESATLSRRHVLRDVVMVEHPRRGEYSYGFVTSYTTRHGPHGPQRLANVFIPGPPLPTSGNLVAVPVEDLLYLELSVDDALKLVLSLGITSPPDLHGRTGVASPDDEGMASGVP